MHGQVCTHTRDSQGLPPRGPALVSVTSSWARPRRPAGPPYGLPTPAAPPSFPPLAPGSRSSRESREALGLGFRCVCVRLCHPVVDEKEARQPRPLPRAKANLPRPPGGLRFPRCGSSLQSQVYNHGSTWFVTSSLLPRGVRPRGERPEASAPLPGLPRGHGGAQGHGRLACGKRGCSDSDLTGLGKFSVERAFRPGGRANIWSLSSPSPASHPPGGPTVSRFLSMPPGWALAASVSPPSAEPFAASLRPRLPPALTGIFLWLSVVSGLHSAAQRLQALCARRTFRVNLGPVWLRGRSSQGNLEKPPLPPSSAPAPCPASSPCVPV